ncbi:MAG TPA: hypothetical protein VMQ78_08835 [Candidatus Limnocylindria bacterium]|nr:hypothetical protein [Candidatus Limnocylindria bacterium]
MWRPASALVLVLLMGACGPRPVAIERTPTPGVIVVPTVLPNGHVEIAVQPHYVLGASARIDVAIITTRGTITGPLEARVMATGMGEGGAPSEVLVRRLVVTTARITAGGRATTSMTWNGEDESGARVPADAYVLVLDFESDDSGTTRTVGATATLQMND